MDIDMPEMPGTEAILLLKNCFPEVNVMILTNFEDSDKLFNALCAGATGCLLKNTSPARLIEAIEEIYHGGSPMSSVIARKVLEKLSHDTFRMTRSISGEKQDNYNLTNRERDVLQRLLMGDSYKMIANACFISIGTVYSHINNIYKKLQINSKSEAVIKAIKERLI
jgi:DNA-binding NarL/FixJ family response regulator